MNERIYEFISYFQFIHVNLLAFIGSYFPLIYLLAGVVMGVPDIIADEGNFKKGASLIIFLLVFFLLCQLIVYIDYKRIIKKITKRPV